MSTRLRIAAALVGGVALTVAVYHLADRPGPQNSILLITLDTTRADHLGCYGYSEPVSPHIDGQAARGVLFENAYSTASVTPVSHASIFTGQNPYTHGLRVMHGLSDNRLSDTAVTLAEILKDAGYQTAAFVSAFPAGSRFGLNQGFDTFDESFLVQPAEQIVDPSGVVNTGRNQRRADETTDAALSWFSQASGTFFVWVHYFDPHDVQMIPPRVFLEQFPPPSGTRVDQHKQIYDIEIQYMDQQIGRLFDALEATQRLEDTVVVIVSDHGQGLGDHNWWTHGMLYQEQIKTPLIIRAPNTPAGRRVKYVVRTIDIAPTILDLVGLRETQSASTEGATLVPMIQGEVADPGYVAYADAVGANNYNSEVGTTDVRNDMLFTVIADTWKYIHHAIGVDQSELYDLKQDPRELTNVYGSRPIEIERLRQDLRARPFEPKRTSQGDQLSDEDRERLRSLGYVH
jgi:arylsulfatase A-like enzyme